jgi:hypothetical protein
METLFRDVDLFVLTELSEIFDMIDLSELDEQIFGVIHRAFSRVERPYHVSEKMWSDVMKLYEHTIGTAFYFAPVEDIEGVVRLCRRRLTLTGLYEELLESDVSKSLENMMI